MKRVFKIGETVYYEDDGERGWGKIVLLNRSDAQKEDVCSDDCGDILTIQKSGCSSEIETTPSRVYQLAKGKKFQGKRVVWEHNEEIDYPLFCPYFGENVFFAELD